MADVSPIDQGAILRSGAALIPDLAQQMLQQRQVAVQEQGLGLEQQKFAAAMAADQRERAQAESYAADVAKITQLPTDQQPQAIIALMQKYPKQSEALKRSYDTQDGAARAADLREAGELYSLVRSGAPDKAALRLRKRIEADRAAGLDTSDDEEVAANLESGDPARVNAAAFHIGMAISTSAGPDKFASTYGALNPDQTEFQKQYDFIKQTYGQSAADTFAQNKYDPVFPVTTQDGTTAFRSSQLMSGPAPSPAASSVAPSAAAPAAEDEAAAILGAAMRTKFVTPEDFSRVEASLGPNGRERAQAWLKNQKIQIGRVIGGKRYVKRGNDWFEVGDAKGN